MGIFGFGKKKQEREEERPAQQPEAEKISAPAAGKPQEELQGENEEKKGLFSRLWQGLSKTRTSVAGRVD